MDINKWSSIGAGEVILKAKILDARTQAKFLAFLLKIDTYLKELGTVPFLQWSNNADYTSCFEEMKLKYGGLYDDAQKQPIELKFEYIGEAITEEQFTVRGEAAAIMRAFSKTFLTDIKTKNWDYQQVVVAKDDDGNDVKKYMRIPLGNYGSDEFFIFDKLCVLSIDVPWLPAKCTTEITVESVPEKKSYSMRVSCPMS
jgi:hypothetical protein